MLGGQDKVWLHYRKDIISADTSTGQFLADYLRHIAIHKIYANHLEVMDLQHYKLLKQPRKVYVALRERCHVPFIFIAGKN